MWCHPERRVTDTHIWRISTLKEQNCKVTWWEGKRFSWLTVRRDRGQNLPWLRRTLTRIKLKTEARRPHEDRPIEQHSSILPVSLWGRCWTISTEWQDCVFQWRHVCLVAQYRRCSWFWVCRCYQRLSIHWQLKRLLAVGSLFLRLPLTRKQTARKTLHSPPWQPYTPQRFPERLSSGGFLSSCFAVDGFLAQEPASSGLMFWSRCFYCSSPDTK